MFIALCSNFKDHYWGMRLLHFLAFLAGVGRIISMPNLPFFFFFLYLSHVPFLALPCPHQHSPYSLPRQAQPPRSEQVLAQPYLTLEALRGEVVFIFCYA